MSSVNRKFIQMIIRRNRMSRLIQSNQRDIHKEITNIRDELIETQSCQEDIVHENLNIRDELNSICEQQLRLQHELHDATRQIADLYKNVYFIILTLTLIIVLVGQVIAKLNSLNP
jgi:hypothetical protein